MLAVEDHRRFAIVRVHIIAHIDFQYFPISIIEVVAAFAVLSSVLGFGKINVRNAVNPDLFKIDEMLLAVFVDRLLFWEYRCQWSCRASSWLPRVNLYTP